MDKENIVIIDCFVSGDADYMTYLPVCNTKQWKHTVIVHFLGGKNAELINMLLLIDKQSESVQNKKS